MFDLEFFTHSDGSLIIATVTYEIIFDSDWYEVGEQIVWRNYSFNQWTTEYKKDGVKYSPTVAEFKEWEREIDQAITSEAA